MKKKTNIPTTKQDTVNDPELGYKVSSHFDLAKNKTGNCQEKKFRRRSAPKDFPNNCVTLDTFFSDLEDYIHNREAL